MRWNTRSDPERSTSISIFGYCSRNALATASPTFTSTDEYQTTLPSFCAAATIAGVVSCARADAAINVDVMAAIPCFISLLRCYPCLSCLHLRYLCHLRPPLPHLARARQRSGG